MFGSENSYEPQRTGKKVTGLQGIYEIIQFEKIKSSL